MSDAVIPVPADWKKRAFMTKAQYDAAYAESLQRSGRFLAQGSGTAGLDQAFHQGGQLVLSTRTICTSNGSRMAP